MNYHNKEPECWQCNKKVIPNPRRYEPNKKDGGRCHPYPELSFYCDECQIDLLLCSECKQTNCEWWYDLGEIWEDMYEKDGNVYCQCCYPGSSDDE